MSLLSQCLLLTSALSIALSLALSAPQGMLMGEKIRLGSTPPSCHNRCNSCNPCAAVQVPTLPGHLAGVEPGPADGPSGNEPAPYSSKYSEYKPLGWKCRCGNRLFNP